MTDLNCDTLVIGAGPGGYVAAIRAGQLGLDTIIVESENVGGTCLNIGCIPSKALIHAGDVFHEAEIASAGSAIGVKAGKPKLTWKKTLAWKDGIVRRLTGGVAGLLKKAKVRTVKGWASFIDGKTVEVTNGKDKQIIRAKNIVIATGSSSVELPNLPFKKNVISSTEALSLKSIPNNLVVVGAGYIGLELGIAFRKLGANVTIVEAASKILPQYDKDLTKPIHNRLGELGIELRLNALAETVSEEDDGGLVIKNQDGSKETLQAERVLVTVGRRPVTENWGRENLVLNMDGPFIQIDEFCQTSMSGIYAIGDVTGEPMLAHRAMAQGELVAECIAGKKRAWDKRGIAAICFTDPELVSVGLSPDEAKQSEYDSKTAMFPFGANGRAMTMERDDGFVRIVYRSDNHLILGIQAVGAGVSELAASFGLAIEMGACLEDVAHTIHAHPSLGEVFQETALRGLGQALHI